MKRTLALCIILAGCQTLPDGGWNKSGASDAMFMQDRGACIAQMESAPYGANKALLFAGCMQGKGWAWEEKK